MEENDKTEALHGISDEELFMQEVVQDDPELYFLHHYLSELYRER